MNQELAKKFIKKNARPLEQATYRFYFEKGVKAEALEELRKYQNEDSEFLDAEIRELIQAELAVLGKLQKEDGGFDISWEWYTPYTEFAQARDWWRPRLTIDKLLFVRNYSK